MQGEVIIDPLWSFEEAVSAASDRFRPGSLMGGQARNLLVQSWAQLVGKRRASSEITAFIREVGSHTAAAKRLSMRPDTLTALIQYVDALPNEGSDIEPIKLRKGPRKLYELLKTKNAGDLISRQDLLAAVGWTNRTLDTYLRKNMLNDFFEQVGKNKFEVLTNSEDLSEQVIALSFSQIQKEQIFISPGVIFRSASSKYVLIKRLGNGAVGHVWRVQDKQSGAFLALKVLNPRRDLLKPTVLHNVKRRFSREARNGHKIRNDHVIRIRDYGDYKGFPFLVMAQAETTLSKQLEARGKFKFDEALDVIHDCSLGLTYLHRNHHVHRDIKPDNILLLKGKYVLGDLGIMKWSDFSDEFISAGTITKNDMQLGSWFYMAPEQNENPASATQASDVYALGVTWYQMLTLDHMSPAKIASGAFADPCDNEDINQLIRQMLNYDPDRRPSAEDVLMLVKKVHKVSKTAA